MSSPLTDTQRRALDKIWAANPVGRHKLHPAAVAAGIDVTQRHGVMHTASHSAYGWWLALSAWLAGGWLA